MTMLLSTENLYSYRRVGHKNNWKQSKKTEKDDTWNKMRTSSNVEGWGTFHLRQKQLKRAQL